LGIPASGQRSMSKTAVHYAPDVLAADTQNPTELRGALFMVGGVNQIIEAWLDDPKETPAELAAICARLCVAVVCGVSESCQRLAP
jgi:hypothetical protein